MLDPTCISVFYETRRKLNYFLQLMQTAYRTENFNMSKCPVCREVLGVARATLGCGHVVCVACLVEWGRRANTCPECRAEFASKPSRGAEQHRYVRASALNEVCTTAFTRTMPAGRIDKVRKRILATENAQKQRDILADMVGESVTTAVSLALTWQGSNA